MKRVFITGKNGGLSIAVSEYLQKKGGVDADRISLRGDSWKRESFSGVDSIVHIAGVTPQNAASPDDYYTVNTELTEALARKCKRDGVRQFIYISSMAVYGITQSMDIGKGTVTEDFPLNPGSDYGKSKLLAEKAVRGLEDDSFSVAVIRVPSIYGKGKTEYIDQYRYLAQKLPVIPRAFEQHYKSAVCVDNLCELIRLVITEDASGIICPDDGQYCAADFCSAIFPNKKKSRAVGRLIEMFLKKNDRILDYYGTLCYSAGLTDVFGGRYRVLGFEDAIHQAYEE